MRIVREGWPFILGCLALAVGLAAAARQTHWNVLGLLSGVAFLLAGFCAYFFRDPSRVIPNAPQALLAPADGRILEIVEGRDPSVPGSVRIIRIFLSVFDVHLQRSPVSGTVHKITYVPGKFLDARDPRAAFENEQNRIEIASDRPDAASRVVTQIAGLIARRIVCGVREGQRIQAGDKIGLIRFGSQVDVVLPLSARVAVKPGERVVSGETVLATFSK